MQHGHAITSTTKDMWKIKWITHDQFRQHPYFSTFIDFVPLLNGIGSSLTITILTVTIMYNLK